MKNPIEINPTEHSFSLYFSEHDCYKIKNGICSLTLSEEEYLKALKNTHHLSNTYESREEKVSYCRDLAKSLIENNSFSKETGIEGKLHTCKHISFVNGQHRTCIAKKLHIHKVIFDKLEKNPLLCGGCSKNEKQKSSTPPSFLTRIKNIILKKKEPSFADGPVDFIDDELWSD